MTYQQLRQYFKGNLADTFDTSEVDALVRLLCEELTGKSYSYLLSYPEKLLPDEAVASLEEICQRLNDREPVQYILRKAWFMGREFEVGPGVLIPRAETEELVQRLLELLPRADRPTLLDIGTGSGCIAISIALALPQVRVVAIDISSDALYYARRNAAKHHARVEFFEADITLETQPWAESKYHAIVSNPPYVRESEKTTMLPHVLNHEPHLALFAPETDAVWFYRHIAKFASKHLAPGGVVVCEINEALGRETATVFSEGGFTETSLHRDIHDKDRFVYACL